MRITGAEDLHADGGWRTISFLKLVTDEGLVGWAEFNETSWNPGLTAVIRKLCEGVIGKDPRAFARIGADLRAQTRMAAGGLLDQGIAAFENACLDLAGKAAGVPVYRLFGGPVRERIPLYWSHCGSFRASMPDLFANQIGGLAVRTLKDVAKLGEEVKRRGFKALKTNPILWDRSPPQMTNPGFRPGLELGRNGDPELFSSIFDQLQAFRDGAGGEVGLLLDVNFGFMPEALRRLAQVLEPLGLFWLECDMHAPQALAELRRSTRVPIASLESIYRAKGYMPFLEEAAVDVAIVDVVWNGLPESLRIAQLAEAHEVNVAPHNFYGCLSSLISAHFCAVVPNLRIMEYEADDVPWQADFVTHAPVVENGEMLLPAGPGWGAEVVEAAVRARPPRR